MYSKNFAMSGKPVMVKNDFKSRTAVRSPGDAKNRLDMVKVRNKLGI